jgi:formylglycine-generating enzyme required for sulfatase activity
MALSVLMLAGACGGGGEGIVTRPVTPVVPDPPVTVTVSPSPLTVSQGASATLTVSISGGSTTSPPALTTCTSATVAIASVSVAGGSCRVTGVAPGTTTITATVSSGQSASANVTVAPIMVMQDALTNLSVSPASASLTVGQTAALTPTPITAGAGVTVSYSYASSNVGVATVSATGLVTGVAAGSATITVTATGAGVGFTTAQRTATASVTVTSATALGIGFGLEQFASIPTGSYLRGSTSGFGDQQPVRTITISAFRMQRTEVTQGQWRQVMGGTALGNPSVFPACGDTCPVEQVSWDDIQQFLTRLNQQDPGKEYRLPTEAEWEYATRAGTTGDYNVAGQPIEALGWIGANSQRRTWPVAQKLQNAWGLFDTHGNVWEWVNDWYDSGYYATSPATNPPGPVSGAFRVLRGGSWSINNASADATSARRFGSTPSARLDYGVGFRLARTP